MARQRKPTTQDFMRLDAIAKHLKVKSRYPAPTFTAEVTAACLSRIAPVVDKMLPCTGEKIALGLGEHLCLTFEEVHDEDDVADIEARYLKRKKEIGFAQLRGELRQPGVDALLFERMHAEPQEPDRWVAVLNLQNSASRAYWNRFHELSHRIAEPPQGILPFKRHQFEASNPVEALVDSVAAEFAFYGPAFRPLVERVAKRHPLSFSVVEGLQSTYAPTASLLSTVNAVVRYWPRPAAALTAEIRGRVNAPDVDRALRVTPQGYSDLASAAGVMFIRNMRVPKGTPIDVAFQSGVEQNASEHLGHWGTSQGKRLSAVDVFTSARRLGERAYALVSA